MRGKLAFLLVLAGLYSPARADNGTRPIPPAPYKHERFFTSFGYGLSIPKYYNLNKVLGYYNATRPYLVTRMGKITATSGFDITLGSTNDNFLLEFSYSIRGARTFGVDSIQGYTERQDIQIRSQFLGAGLSTRVFTKNRVKLYMGGTILFGWEGIYARRYRDFDAVRPPMTAVGKPDLLLGITIAPQIHYLLDKAGRFRLVARPYFFLDFLEAYYGDLNKTINPNTYQNNNNNSLYGFPTCIGAELKFFIAI